MTATILVFLVRPRKGMNPTCSAPCELCERYGKPRWKFFALPIGSMAVHTTYIYHTFTIKIHIRCLEKKWANQETTITATKMIPWIYGSLTWVISVKNKMNLDCSKNEGGVNKKTHGTWWLVWYHLVDMIWCDKYQKGITPWKINMEHSNHPFLKENDPPNLYDYVPC